MIYHIITGDFAAGPLREAINLNTTLEGEVVVMKDVLSLGPLHDEAGLPFSALRSSFWQQVVPSEKTPIEVDDLHRLIETANELSKNPGHALWLWVAPLPADVCMYLWSLRYLSKYAGRIFVVNIAGLPFLDTESRLFFPSRFADVTPSEIVKASRLARAVNPSEFEIDSEDWDRLGIENGMVRTLEGSKKIASKPVAFYDHFFHPVHDRTADRGCFGGSREHGHIHIASGVF